MAGDIVEQLGKHKSYFEPFCGSMAVLFSKPPAAQEMVNDLHRDVTNLAWCLQNDGMAAEIYERANRLILAEDLIRSMWVELGRSECQAEPDPDRAFKFFATSWAMRNGLGGTARARGNGFSIALRYTPGGGSPTVRLKSAAASIPEWHDRLRNVVVTRRDAFAMLDKFDDASGLAIYADPPYVSSTRTGFKGSGATSKYEHEFNHDSPLFGDDHDRLAKTLKRFSRARVVVSYYDCDRVRDLYAGWTFVECGRQKHLYVSNRRGEAKQTAHEVLIVNVSSNEMEG